MQSSPLAWTHIRPKLQYPYITSRKTTYHSSLDVA
uniref:Uncharacterized protein n=1 Tax=Anguilla anguilla TaxID=7936 RepID=A0A0E9XWS5_ANGAN